MDAFINVSSVCKDYSFPIYGASYVGNPQNNTIMYATKKIEYQLSKLDRVKECLVFIEDTVNVDQHLRKNHCFISSSNPSYEYAQFAIALSEVKKAQDASKKYTLTKDGYYLGEGVKLGEGCCIEPHCVIGHGVKIGNHAYIMANTVIKNAAIGNFFICNENSVVGAQGFTMSRDKEGNLFRIPTLGKVIIGDHVEVGALNNISCGSAGNTVIKDYVKLDAHVHIGHDDVIDQNTEIPAGAVLSGFVNVGKNVFVGVNATLRNRIDIGDNVLIGMGAVCTKSIESDQIVVGNPAKPFDKKV